MGHFQLGAAADGPQNVVKERLSPREKGYKNKNKSAQQFGTFREKTERVSSAS